MADSIDKFSFDISQAKKELTGLRSSISQLNQKLIENGKLTKEDSEDLKELKSRYNALNSEINNYEKSQYTLEGAQKSFRQECRQLQEELTKLRLEGKEGTKEYQDLANRLGTLRDAYSDAAREVNSYANDTRKLTLAIGAVKDGIAIYGALTSAMQAFGKENSNSAKVIKKLQTIQLALNSAQTIYASLLDRSTLLGKAYASASTVISSVMKGIRTSTIAATVATKNFKKALAETGFGLIAIAIGAIATKIMEVVDAEKAEQEALKETMRLKEEQAKREKEIDDGRLKRKQDLNRRLRIEAGQESQVLQEDVDNAQKKIDDLEADMRKKAHEFELEHLKKYREQSLAPYYKAIEERDKIQSIINDLNELPNTAAGRKRMSQPFGPDNQYTYDEYLNKMIAAYSSRVSTIEKLSKEKDKFDKIFAEWEKGGSILSNLGLKKFSETEEWKALDEEINKAQDELLDAKNALKEFRKSQLDIAYNEAYARLQEQFNKEELERLKNHEDKVLAHYVSEYDRIIELQKRFGKSSTEVEIQRQKAINNAMDSSIPKDVTLGVVGNKDLKSSTKLGEYTGSDLNVSTPVNPDNGPLPGKQSFGSWLQGHKDEVIETVGAVTDGISTLATSTSDIMTSIFDNMLLEIERTLDEVGKQISQSEDLINGYQDSIRDFESRLAEAAGTDAENLTAQLNASKQAMQDEIAMLQSKQERERQLKNQQAQLEYKQQKGQMTSDLLSSIANTALAVSRCWAETGVAGAITGAVAAAAGAATTATIGVQLSKLKPQKFEHGGLLNGPTHSQGGIKVPNTNIELEGSEYVVNKQASKQFLPLLEIINSFGSSNGKFKNGGVLPTIDTYQQPIFVTVKDINSVNDRLNNVRVR